MKSLLVLFCLLLPLTAHSLEVRASRNLLYWQQLDKEHRRLIASGILQDRINAKLPAVSLDELLNCMNEQNDKMLPQYRSKMTIDFLGKACFPNGK